MAKMHSNIPSNSFTCLEKIEQSFCTNLQLLGLDIDSAPKKYGCYISKDMFRVANVKGMEAVLHFLLLRTCPESKAAFRVIWPIIDKRQSREFKACAYKLLLNLERQLHIPTGTVRISYLHTCSGERFLHLVWHLSNYALFVALETENPRKLPSMCGLSKPSPLLNLALISDLDTLEVLKESITRSIHHQTVKFLEKAQSIAKCEVEWKTIAQALEKDYRIVQKDFAVHREKKRCLQQMKATRPSIFKHRATYEPNPSTFKHIVNDKLNPSCDNDHAMIEFRNKIKSYWIQLVTHVQRDEETCNMIKSILDQRANSLVLDAKPIFGNLASSGLDHLVKDQDNKLNLLKLFDSWADCLSSLSDKFSEINHFGGTAESKLMLDHNTSTMKTKVAEINPKTGNSIIGIHPLSHSFPCGENANNLQPVDDPLSSILNRLEMLIIRHGQHLKMIQKLIYKLKRSMPDMHGKIANFQHVLDKAISINHTISIAPNDHRFQHMSTQEQLSNQRSNHTKDKVDMMPPWTDLKQCLQLISFPKKNEMNHLFNLFTSLIDTSNPSSPLKNNGDSDDTQYDGDRLVSSKVDEGIDQDLACKAYSEWIHLKSIGELKPNQLDWNRHDVTKTTSISGTLKLNQLFDPMLMDPKDRKTLEQLNLKAMDKQIQWISPRKNLSSPIFNSKHHDLEPNYHIALSPSPRSKHSYSMTKISPVKIGKIDLPSIDIGSKSMDIAIPPVSSTLSIDNDTGFIRKDMDDFPAHVGQYKPCHRLPSHDKENRFNRNSMEENCHEMSDHFAKLTLSSPFSRKLGLTHHSPVPNTPTSMSGYENQTMMLGNSEDSFQQFTQVEKQTLDSASSQSFKMSQSIFPILKYPSPSHPSPLAKFQTKPHHATSSPVVFNHASKLHTPSIKSTIYQPQIKTVSSPTLHLEPKVDLRKQIVSQSPSLPNRLPSLYLQIFEDDDNILDTSLTCDSLTTYL